MSDQRDFLITSRELIEVGVCFEGQKTWFPEHGFDLRTFIRNGVLASELEKTEDGIALRAVKLLRERNGF